jgi:cytochrome c oxidase assembly protein subunit 15
VHPILTRLGRLRRATISPGAYRVITLAALVALGAIIVTGAAVRLTGSGMGCPTWPACEDGSLVPRGQTGEHGWIEFLNRVFTGIVSVAVILAVLGSRRRRPLRPDLTRWSWGLVAGVFAQALLGGLVVFLHVAPIAVAGHYLLSAVLMWNAVVLHHKAGEPEGSEHVSRRPVATAELARSSAVMVALGALVLVTGTLVTGSGPHGGDEAADRLPFAVVTVARIHSLSVWVFLVVAVLVLRQITRGSAEPDAVGRGRVLLGTLVAQGAIGYVQYFAGVPELLVAGHVLGSVIVWVAVLRFHLALTEPVPLDVATPQRAGVEARPAPSAPIAPVAP